MNSVVGVGSGGQVLKREIAGKHQNWCAGPAPLTSGEPPSRGLQNSRRPYILGAARWYPHPVLHSVQCWLSLLWWSRDVCLILAGGAQLLRAMCAWSLRLWPPWHCGLWTMHFWQEDCAEDPWQLLGL